MQSQWYQVWGTLPLLGRQWIGWLWADLSHAMAMDLALKSCPTIKYEVLDQQGKALPTSSFQFPGLGQLPGLGGYFPS